MDINRMIRDLEKQVAEQIELEIRAKIKQIELLYCPIHGSFAKIENKVQGIQEKQLRFNYCCESQKRDIENVLKLLE
jgi:hypothetical protein